MALFCNCHSPRGTFSVCGSPVASKHSVLLTSPSTHTITTASEPASLTGSRVLQSPRSTCCQPFSTICRPKGPPSEQRVAALENFQAFAFRAALTHVLEHMPASARTERTAQAAEGCAYIKQAKAPKGTAS